MNNVFIGSWRCFCDQTSGLAEMFRLLGEPNRLSIVAGPGSAAAASSEIASWLGLSQSLVCHHLRLLRAARLLKAGRRGKQMFYSIPDCHVREMLTNMIEHLAGARISVTKTK